MPLPVPRSGNPSLNDRVFGSQPRPAFGEERMTLQGTVNKSFLLLVVLLAGAFWPWSQYLTTGDASVVQAPLLIGATLSIAVVYGISMLLGLFHVQAPLMVLNSGSPLGIIISLVIVGVAALNLILDFNFIESGAAQGAPRYMEWYGAFALLVTMVWLYLEILRLLSKVRRD